MPDLLNLVTGATGILGSHVVLHLLKKNQKVIATRRSGSNLQKVQELFRFYCKEGDELFSRIEWIDLDITDYFGVEKALENIDVVYHCAGFVSFDSSDRDRLFRINEGGTANVVNACLYNGRTRMCHVSSVAAISNSDYAVLDEDVVWKKSGFESVYGLSKYNAEREVWRGIEEGLQAVIINPGVILAPVFWDQSSGKLFERCARGNLFYTRGTNAYVYAPDVAEVMVKLVEGHYFGNRYIVVEGNYELRTVLSEIQLRLGRRPPRISAHKGLLRFVALLEELSGLLGRKKRVLTKSLVHSAFNTQKLSNKKVNETLGLKFKPLQEALDEICGYYKTVS